MTKLLVHFPVIIALVLCLGMVLGSLNSTLWLLIPSWQLLCAAVMLMMDSNNREKRYRKILFLVRAGKELKSLPRENTICGFFIRKAVQWKLKGELK